MTEICLTRGTGSNLVVYLDDAQMQIDGLHITASSNTSKPYYLHGLGGAKMLMNNNNFVKLLHEYARYTLQESVSFESKSVAFNANLTYVSAE